MNVVIIDTGSANLGSVRHALTRLGVVADTTCDISKIAAADRVILPGVGHARTAMAELERAGLIGLISSLTQPVLGICLGLQLLYESSSEGDVDCLGVIPGRVEPLTEREGLRLPHMGWNQLKWRDDADPLARELGPEAWFYFVHSFAAPVEHAVATCCHGDEFAAIVRYRNFAACQFHPEKSAAVGARLMANFLLESRQQEPLTCS